MVLRKPYALLIKYFRLIHLVLTGFMIYLVIRTSTIHGYITAYIKTGEVPDQSGYITGIMIFILFIVVAVCTFMFLLMRQKKKPRITYLITVVCYVFVFILISLISGFLVQAKDIVLDPKMLRLYRDLLISVMIYEYIAIAIMAFRGLGFDIKKFDFKTDLQELNIDITDNEEFEVSSPINIDYLKRKGRRFTRETKYFILENKLIFSIIFSVILLIIIYNVTMFFMNRDVYHPENKYVSGSILSLNVKKTIITDKDYKGLQIGDGTKTFVVASVNIKANRSLGDYKLNLNDFKLIINKNGYYPINQICESFYDIGSCYQGAEVTAKEKEYILIYPIDKADASEKKIIRYQDWAQKSSATAKFLYFNISPNNLANQTTEASASLTEELTFNNLLLTSKSLNINTYDLGDEFIYNYVFSGAKYTNTIVPTNKNKDKTILKLEPVLTDYTISKIQKVFIDFGTLKYKIEGNEYIANVIDKTPKNAGIEDNKYIYVEVPSKIKEADSIYFEFKLRNKTYTYNLK